MEKIWIVIRNIFWRMEPKKNLSEIKPPLKQMKNLQIQHLVHFWPLPVFQDQTFIMFIICKFLHHTSEITHLLMINQEENKESLSKLTTSQTHFIAPAPPLDLLQNQDKCKDPPGCPRYCIVATILGLIFFGCYFCCCFSNVQIDIWRRSCNVNHYFRNSLNFKICYFKRKM